MFGASLRGGSIVHIVNAGNYPHYANELQQAYRLRHRVFVEECGWAALQNSNEYEIDQFDTEHAINILATDGRGKVVGYSRLLPTANPHLLTDVYPHLAQRKIPRSPTIFEWTRYCVAPERRGDSAIRNVGSRLLCGVLEYAFREGIAGLTMETDPLWITRFLEFGFEAEPLGFPQQLDGSPVVALSVGLSANAIERCRRLLRLKPLVWQTRGRPLPAVSIQRAA
jgi:acyl-homoserine lactone synthase